MLDGMNALRALCLAWGDRDRRHVTYVLEAQTQRASWEMGQCGQVCEIQWWAGLRATTPLFRAGSPCRAATGTGQSATSVGRVWLLGSIHLP